MIRLELRRGAHHVDGSVGPGRVPRVRGHLHTGPDRQCRRPTTRDYCADCAAHRACISSVPAPPRAKPRWVAAASFATSASRTCAMPSPLPPRRPTTLCSVSKCSRPAQIFVLTTCTVGAPATLSTTPLRSSCSECRRTSRAPTSLHRHHRLQLCLDRRAPQRLRHARLPGGPLSLVRGAGLRHRSWTSPHPGAPCRAPPRRPRHWHPGALEPAGSRLYRSRHGPLAWSLTR